MRKPVGFLLAAALLSGVTQANAEGCLELYAAIKREAMYCSFFCDQQRLAPLQASYEAACIKIYVPLDIAAPFENSPDERPLLRGSISIAPMPDTSPIAFVVPNGDL